MIGGLILWQQLPDSIAVHFGTNNTPDGWAGKPFAVLGIPLLLLAVHLLCIGITLNDPKKKNISEKMKAFIFWIVPILSLVCNLVTYTNALGKKMDVGTIVGFAVGIVFIVVVLVVALTPMAYSFVLYRKGV